MHPQHGHNRFMRITAPALATGVAVVLVVAAMRCEHGRCVAADRCAGLVADTVEAADRG